MWVIMQLKLKQKKSFFGEIFEMAFDSNKSPSPLEGCWMYWKVDV